MPLTKGKIAERESFGFLCPSEPPRGSTPHGEQDEDEWIMNAAQALGLAIGLLFYIALRLEERNKRGPPATAEDVLEEVTLIDDFEDVEFEEEG